MMQIAIDRNIYIYIYIGLSDLSSVGLSDLGGPRRELEPTNIDANETNDTDTGEPRGANTDTRTWPTPNKQEKYTAANFRVPNNLPARPTQRNTFADLLRRVRGLDPRSGSEGGDTNTSGHSFLRSSSI